MIIDILKLDDGKDNYISNQELIRLSRRFLNELDIDPDQPVEDVRIQIYNATTILSQLVSLITTTLADVYMREPKETKEAKELLELGIMYRLEEDLGAIINDLKDKLSYKLGDIVGIFNLVRFAAELKTAYLFLVYYPIITANKYNRHDITEYIKDFFRTFRSNASILGYGNKITVKSSNMSRMLMPSPEAMISSSVYKNEGVSPYLDKLKKSQSEELSPFLSDETDEVNDEEHMEEDS